MSAEEASCPCGCGGELHIPTSALIEQRDVELDHAVAAERNRIADWLVGTRCITPAVANVIRDGAHWKTT